MCNINSFWRIYRVSEIKKRGKCTKTAKRGGTAKEREKKVKQKAKTSRDEARVQKISKYIN